MDKNQQIKFAKRKHLKQLKRNAKNKHLRLQRMRIKVELRKIRKFNLDAWWGRTFIRS